VFLKTAILSKSKNSVFLGTETKGKVHGIVNQGKLILA
jgi:dihydroorotase